MSGNLKKHLKAFRKKQKKLDIANKFFVDVFVSDNFSDYYNKNKIKHVSNKNKISLFAFKFNFQNFVIESDTYLKGFQQHSYISDIRFLDVFSLDFRENPSSPIVELLYNYIQKFVKNKQTRIINNTTIFEEVNVYKFLDPIKQMQGNQYQYTFNDVYLYDYEDNDIVSSYEEESFNEFDLKFKFNKVSVDYVSENGERKNIFENNLKKDK